MLIQDLPNPVTASKADWLPGTTWLGFTPTGIDNNSRNLCQSTIQRQFKNGYVIEYITEQFGQPNSGFEEDKRYLAQRESHKAIAGRLIAVHRLRTTSRPLRQIMGDKEFDRLQDMWAQDSKRVRWSVAFPIIESYRIVNQPKARDVFDESSFRRLYQRPSATLRELNDTERSAIANQEIAELPAQNAWIGIEDEFEFAEGSDIARRTQKLIDKDLSDGALEGVEVERRVKIRKRAAWLAEKFVRIRRTRDSFVCDNCGFDPRFRLGHECKFLRSVLDVHHKNPLDEGKRYTTVNDFALLCPTCHRIEHLLIGSK